MQPVLFDSSVYIAALRGGAEAAVVLLRGTQAAPVWLSAVVLEELYAGSSPRDRRVVERMERDFDRARRILVPNLTDWTQTGKVLAHIGRKYLEDAEAAARFSKAFDELAEASRAETKSLPEGAAKGRGSGAGARREPGEEAPGELTGDGTFYANAFLTSSCSTSSNASSALF